MKRNLFICFLLVISTAWNLTACNEDIEIDGVTKDSTEYWCYVSGGSWITSNNTTYCQCNGVQCGEGIVCMNKDNQLQCAASN